MEMTKDIVVQIESAGGSLTMTPMGLLSYFLPGARPDPKTPNLFIGRQAGANKDCYVQLEALWGMLTDAKEKGLNPITQMYLIASNSPDKRAGHKINYKVGLERARLIPGFLGINAGLVVQRAIDPLLVLNKKLEIRAKCQELGLTPEMQEKYLALVPDTEILHRTGAMFYEGDTILAGWAEAYIGLAKPIRHEVSADQFWQDNFQWKDKGSWMLVKVTEDQLCNMKLASMYASKQPRLLSSPQEEEEGIVLEAQPSTALIMPGAPITPYPIKEEPKPGVQATPFHFLPDHLYVGTISQLRAKKDTVAGGVIVATEHGNLTCFFYSRPGDLHNYDLDKEEVKKGLIGQTCALSFSEKVDKKTEEVWRYVERFELARPHDEPMTEGPSPEEERE